MMPREYQNAMLYLTNDCNLNCAYCFVEKDKGSMSYKTGKASIDFMLNQAKNSKRISINFFGGEPLLQYQLIKRLIKYGKNKEKAYHKRIHFGITTNGTLFTPEIVDFFKKNNIGILLSFEGDKKRMEKVKGKEAYKKCIWAVKELKRRKFKITARTTVEPSDLRLVDFTKHIFSLGFDNISFVGVGEERWNQKKTDEAFMELAKYYINQVKRGNVLELNYLHRYLAIKHKIKQPSPVPCGAGRGMVGVTVDGKILPCHHPEAWLKDYVLGDVFEGKINQEKRSIFLKYKRDDFIGCDNCLARSYCIGCCLARSYTVEGNMFQPSEGHCIWVKARVKAVEYIYDVLIKKEKNKHLLKYLKRFKKKNIPLPIKLTLNNLKEFEPYNNLNRLYFHFNKEDLNKKSGDKIISFLNSLQQRNIKFNITKPLPRCLFGSDYSIITKKFNIPKNCRECAELYKIEDGKIILCNGKKGKNKKKYKNKDEIFKEFSAKTYKKLLDKCRNCIYKLRKQCEGLYPCHIKE